MKIIKYWINDIYYEEQILENNNSTTISQKCSDHNIDLPCFCYHESLSIAGSCRMCLVEINTSLKLVVSCSMPLTDGVKIYTSTNRVRKAREAVIEFLLINHPLDCPICDQGGECDLQDITLLYGFVKSRYYEYTKFGRFLLDLWQVINLILSLSVFLLQLMAIYYKLIILFTLNIFKFLLLRLEFILLPQYSYNHQVHLNLHANASIVYFHSSQTSFMIVRKFNSTTSIRTVRHRIKKYFQSQTKLDEEQVVPIYIEGVNKSLKKNPRFTEMSKQWNSNTSTSIEIFDEMTTQAVNDVLEQDIKDIRHPGIKNAVCFDDPDGVKQMVLYGSNITHSKSVKGVKNVDYARNHDGTEAKLTSYAKASLPIEVTKFEEGNLVDKKYLTDPTKFPIDSESKAYEALKQGKVKLIVDTNDGQLIEITGKHQEAYMNPPNPDKASVYFAGGKINALHVTPDDPIAKASLTAYDDRAEKVLSNLEETLNKFRD